MLRSFFFTIVVLHETIQNALTGARAFIVLHSMEGGEFTVSHNDLADAKFMSAVEHYKEGLLEDAYNDLKDCLNEDTRCQTLLGDFHFLGLVPRSKKDMVLGILLWQIAADRGSADGQFRLAAFYANFFSAPHIYAFNSRESLRKTQTSPADKCHSQIDLLVSGKLIIPDAYSGFKSELEVYFNKFKSIGSRWSSTTIPYLRKNQLSLSYLYAAAFAQHTGASMAMGYRHEKGVGVPKSCSSAVAFLMNVAKKTVRIYSNNLPPAIELIRLALPSYEGLQRLQAHQEELHVPLAEDGNPRVSTALGARFLLGFGGFKRNYSLALHFLQIGFDGGQTEAAGLIGYIYALGLGVNVNLDLAAEYFYVAAHEFDDSVGYNGMGYIYFVGTSKYPRDFAKALEYFTKAATMGLPDGEFNTASMYLTGTGVETSESVALHWYTSAVSKGHSAAAYALAVMHLNGIGTLKDCHISLSLLRKICEKNSWVADGLQIAYNLEIQNNKVASAFTFWLLAESGHEISQCNLAHILDKKKVLLFCPDKWCRLNNHIFAQRFYTLSADQGSSISHIRLGDYNYYGLGLETVMESAPVDKVISKEIKDAEGKNLTPWLKASVFKLKEMNEPNYHQALYHYRIAKDIQPYLKSASSRASYLIGHMYQWGLGTEQDFEASELHYHKCHKLDPNVPTTVAALAVLQLRIHKFVVTNNLHVVYKVLKLDPRVRLLSLVCVLISMLVITRVGLRISRMV